MKGLDLTVFYGRKQEAVSLVPIQVSFHIVFCIVTAVHRSTVMTQEEKESSVHFIFFLCFTGSIVNTVTELYSVLFYLH